MPPAANLPDEIIGASLRRLRLVAGIRVAEIAALWNRSTDYVVLVEAGLVRPTAEELAAAVGPLKCRIYDLFSDLIQKTLQSLD